MKLRSFLFGFLFVSALIPSSMAYASGIYIPLGGPNINNPCIKDKDSKECKDKLDKDSAKSKSDKPDSSKE